MLKAQALAVATALSLFSGKIFANSVSQVAQDTASYAVATYKEAMIDSLAELVKHNTVAKKDVPSTENPVHIAFKQELAAQAKALGLEYSDQGYLVIISLGDSKERLGIITHGDVQPATPSKWAKSPL